MSKGMKRFFLICAVIFAAGGIMAIAGIAAGGISGLVKLSDRYDWFIGPGETTETVTFDTDGVQPTRNGQLFDSIKITGDADVTVCRGSDATKTNATFGVHYKVPDMHISNGVLYIDSNTGNSEGGVVNISGSDAYPHVRVYVPEDWKIKNIKADTSCGDISISDISVGKTDIKSDSGDIHMKSLDFDRAGITADSGDVDITEAEGGSFAIRTDSGDITVTDSSFSSGSVSSDSGDIDAEGLKSSGFEVKTGSGECIVSGELKGTTTVSSDSGDAYIKTSLRRSEYDLNTDLDSGDIDTEGSDTHSKHHSGRYTMNVQLGSGDLELTFR